MTALSSSPATLCRWKVVRKFKADTTVGRQMDTIASANEQQSDDVASESERGEDTASAAGSVNSITRYSNSSNASLLSALAGDATRNVCSHFR